MGFELETYWFPSTKYLFSPPNPAFHNHIDCFCQGCSTKQFGFISNKVVILTSHIWIQDGADKFSLYKAKFSRSKYFNMMLQLPVIFWMRFDFVFRDEEIIQEPTIFLLMQLFYGQQSESFWSYFYQQVSRIHSCPTFYLCCRFHVVCFCV